MEVALRRLHKTAKFLNYSRQLWPCQQSNLSIISTQAIGRYFHTPSKNPYTLRGMLENDQQSRNSNKLKFRDVKKPKRTWHTAMNKPSANGQQIKVISYNILAQDLLVRHLELYTMCNPHHLRWSYRLPRLTEEIISCAPDILCMQEVQDTHLDDIALNLKSKLSMDFVYKKKTGLGNDGCAIFFNKNIFDLVESDAVQYYQPGCERLDRHNIAVIAKLRCKANPDYVLLVCTTHLLYNPRRQDVRLAQLMVLLAELDRQVIRFEQNGGELRKLPLVLMGDFNFPPKSAPFELLSTGSLSYEGLSRNTLVAGEGPPAGKVLIPPSFGITDNCQHIDCVESNYRCLRPRIRTMKQPPVAPDFQPADITNSNMFSTGTLTHSFNLTSIFSHIANPEDYGSTYHNKWITVDHFFFSEGVGPNSSLELEASYDLPSVRECANIPALPNAHLGSDHLLLAAKFNLVFSEDADATS